MTFTVYAKIADDPYCSAKLTFQAKKAFLINKNELVIEDRQDGQVCQFVIKTSETFSQLEAAL
jgi:hypothetical protein